MTTTPDPANIMAAMNSASTLDPESVVAAASVATSRQEAIGNATATAAYAQATNTVATLQKMDVSQQRALWNASTPQEQQQYASVGYTAPPGPQATGKSAGSSLVGGVFNDIAHIGATAGKWLQRGVGDAMNATSSPLRFTQHLLRTRQVMGEMGELKQGESEAHVAARAEGGSGNSIDINDFADMFSASAWSRAWRETSNGEKSFDPAIERQIRSQVDPGTFKIASALASGVPEQEVVNSYAPAQRQAIVKKIANNPELKETVQKLQASKISVGRSIVGEPFLVKHPELGKLISGGIDAATDVAIDPTFIGGKGAEAYDAAKWGIDASTAAHYTAGNSSDYEALINNWADRAGAQRWMDTVTKTINEKGYGALQDVDPRLAKVSGQLADAGVDSPDSLKTWLSSQAGMSAVLGGKAARLSGTAAIMPHLSASGLARLTAKGVFKSGVDFLADRGTDADEVVNALKSEPLHAGDLAGMSGPSGVAMDALHVLPDTAADVAPVDGEHMMAKRAGGYASSVVLGGPTKVARAFRQMTTLTADKPYLDLADPESAINLKRMLQYAMPSQAVNKIVDMYVRTPDMGQKFNIVKAATEQMLQLAGVYSDRNGPGVGEEIMDALDKSFHGETYSPLGLDKFADNSRSAVLDGQENTRVFLPSFHEVRAAAKQNTFLKGLGIDVPGAAEKFMSAWRTGVLFRVGFPIRVSLDEDLGYALREGGLGMIASRLANRTAKKAADALKATQDAEDGIEPQISKIGRAVGVLTDHIPAPVVGAAQSTRDFATSIFGDAAWRAFHVIDPSISREQYHEAAALFHKNVWDGLSPNISAVAHAGGGYDQAEDLKMIMTDGKPTVVRWKDKGTYSEATAADPLYRQKWAMSLGTVARSKIGQAVLADIDESNQTQVRNVMKILEDPGFADQKSMFKRSFSTPDGRQLGVDATQKEVDKEWARTAVAHVNALVRSSDPQEGDVLDDVVKEMLRTGAEPRMQTLEKVAARDLPASVYGPDMVPIASKTADLVQKGFTHLSQMMDWLAREPNTLHAFTKALQEVRPWAEKFAGKGENADELASHIAAERALNTIKPYIHSPEIRSQFEVLHRTAMPFLFAQDQFIKRWVKTFVTHPSAIAKAQLGMNGLRTSGIIQRDQDGNEFFYYPGSQYVTTAIARAAQAIGIPASVPLSIPFTGQVKNIMPGLSNPLTPSVGPTCGHPHEGPRSDVSRDAGCQPGGPSVRRVEQLLGADSPHHPEPTHRNG